MGTTFKKMEVLAMKTTVIRIKFSVDGLNNRYRSIKTK